MKFVYSLFISIFEKLLPLSALFSPKLKKFVAGRKNVVQVLDEKIQSGDKVIWFHAASLGEYEQGVPVMEAVKREFPSHKIVLTFFSPSGFEAKKNNSLADCTLYLPLDTRSNARKFIAKVEPVLAVFIKYEVWPNYLSELKKKSVPAMLVSGLFRANQIYFKAYGGFLRKALRSFDCYFLQDETSKNLLKSIHVHNSEVSGDTRFDRVSHQIEQDNTLDFLAEFTDGKTCVIAGSTWPEDEALLVDFINTSSKDTKFVIVPHVIKKSHLEKLKKNIQKKTVFFSERDNLKLAEYQVFVIDVVGLLTKIYSYADVAYVGGGMGKLGLHNILEPATFGVPIIIGKNFEKFPEAKRLQHLAGLFVVENTIELHEILTKLLEHTDFRRKTGMIAGHFIQSNTGATRIIMKGIKEII